MRCQNVDPCTRRAEGLYRLFSTRTERALCGPCHERLTAMGMHLIPVETGWISRAIARDLPPRASA